MNKMISLVAAMVVGMSSTSFADTVLIDQALVTCGVARTDLRAPSEDQSCTTASSLPSVRVDYSKASLHVQPALGGGKIAGSVKLWQGVKVGLSLGLESSEAMVKDVSKAYDSRTYGALAWGQLGDGAEWSAELEHRHGGTADSGVGTLRAGLLAPLASGSAAPYVTAGAHVSNGDYGSNASQYGLTIGLGLRLGVSAD